MQDNKWKSNENSTTHLKNVIHLKTYTLPAHKKFRYSKKEQRYKIHMYCAKKISQHGHIYQGEEHTQIFLNLRLSNCIYKSKAMIGWLYSPVTN
jgi:Golgi nucleoside diphosphatase